MGILDAPVNPIPRVLPPSSLPAFVKLPTAKVYRLGGGRFRTVLNLTPIIPATTGTAIYVDRAGSSGNTGLTPGSPWNAATAITAINAGTHFQYDVYLMDGEVQSTAWTTITKSCRWIAYRPGARITGWVSPGVTWTLESGSAGVAGAIYSTAKLSTNGMFDLANVYTWTDRTGRVHRNYTEYPNKGTGANSAAAMALLTSDGQHSYDSTKVYCRPIGGADLTNSTTRNNVRMRQNNTTGITASGNGVVVYVKGIAFEGHSTFGAASNAILVAEDCSFKYTLADGTTHNGGHAISIRCVATGCGRDGFNYHDAAGNNTEFYEIDCVSGYNGLLDVTNDNNNATTSHDTCRGIRVNGSYSHTSGPTHADVNSAKSWNPGFDGRDSIAVNANQRQNIRVDTTAEVWFDEPSFDGANLNVASGVAGTGSTTGSGTGYNFHASGASSKIHLSGVRGAAWPISIEPANVGTIDIYQPIEAA